jgi:signal transduction histidine kinase
MLIVLALGGWAAAVVSGATALFINRTLHRRLHAIARASHELRGGIGAARLGLGLAPPSGTLEPARLRAVELELDRAALALEELDGHPVGWACERVDVLELLTASVGSWQPAAAVHGAEVHLSWSGERAVVLGDRVRLAQATTNLIANAIEHGGEVVEVRGTRVGDAVRLEVLDNGPGLPKPISELIRRRHDQRGRGLGLGIAADVISGHGGQLSAAPSAAGARLVIELPSPEGRQERLRQAESVAPGLRLTHS